MLVRIICICCVAFIPAVKGTLVGDCPGVNLSCTVHKFNGDACSPSALRATFPGMYETNTSSFPGMPGSLDISARYKYWPKKQRYKPEANLTFTTPQSGAINYVKGFEIIRVSPGVAATICFILDLSNVTWKNSIEELSTKFRLELFPLQYRFYSFTLYALPKQENKDEVYDQYLRKYVELPEYVDDPTPRNWRASIYITQNNEEGSIDVRIDSPPPEFGFTEFEYDLVLVDTEEIIQHEQEQGLTATFSELYDNQTYKVWVKPYDPHYLSMDPDKCICLDADEIGCAHCKTTTTQAFTYFYTGPSMVTTTTTTAPKTTRRPVQTPEPAVDTTASDKLHHITEEPEGESDVKIAMAIIGTLMGIALILGVAGFMYRRNCRRTYGGEMTHPDKKDPKDGPGLPLENPGFNGSPLHKGPNNLFAEKLKFDKRPKLVLLYEEDHEYHRQVVQHFASFLQQHCQCAAMCVEWQLDAPWVHEDIEQADYVVIVNSEGAYQSYMTQYDHKNNVNGQFKSTQVSKQMSNINSIRNKFLHDERYDNVVMVYFEYTDEQFVLPDICPGYRYKLLKHFTDFLLHIHKLRRTHNLSLYDLPFDGSFSKKPIGQQMLEAMNKATQYQTDNPNWAKKKLAYSRMYSHTSEESQFDSGLPDDWLRIPSVDNLSRSFQSNPTQRELLRILDGKSVCTLDPSEIGVSVQTDGYTLNLISENVPQVGVTKLRPKLSPHSFDGNQNPPYFQNTPSPPTCSSTVESDFGFFPPDDFDENFDTVSKTISEQMKSIVDRYHAFNHDENDKKTNTAQYQTPTGGAPEPEKAGTIDRDDRINDLYLLKVQSGEIPFISCNMDGDTVSLGGESV